jgi:GAF domain-containing protein
LRDMEAHTKMATAAGWTLHVLGVVVLESLLLAWTGAEIAQLTLVASTLLFAALLRPLRRRLSGYVDRRLKERLALRAAGRAQGPHAAREHRT